MKQFLANSSYNYNQKSTDRPRSTVRLSVAPSVLSSSYSQREALFNDSSRCQSIFAPYISSFGKYVRTEDSKQLVLKSVLNDTRVGFVNASAQLSPINLPARRKRLRSFSRAYSISKTGSSSPNSFFFFHQSSFFNKIVLKPQARGRNAKADFSKKLHVPVLLNSSSSDTPSKIQRFGSSWGTGLTSPHTHVSFSSVLSLLRGAQVSFVIRPALALARYAFDLEAVRSALGSNQSLTASFTSVSIPLNSARFLRHLEQEISGRFQYVAIQIPDLLRVSFACRYFKKPSVLANLFAQTLSALPRNRKETQFLRFLRKVVKVFSAQRTERLGVRLRFKGRVNRWRRTKHIIGEKGRLPFYTYSARLEIGEAQAITRKGTLGIRIWLAYHPSFARSFRRTLLSFIRVRATDSINLLINVSTNPSPFS